MDDQRFAHVGRDPKFRSMPKKYKKVKIDKRFDAMFKDNRFKLKYTVDKRGRPVNFSSSEDLKRYYEADEQSGEEDAAEDQEEVSEAEEEDQEDVKGTAEVSTGEGSLESADSAEEDEVNDNDVSDVPKSPAKAKSASAKKTKKAKKTPKKSKAASSEPTTDTTEDKQPVKLSPKDKKKKGKKLKQKAAEELPPDEEVGEEVREKLLDLAVDYARGGGVLMEDSSSDDESEPEEVEVEHDWAELDREAPRIPDEEVTSRLALCNMDWDRIKAQDIMVLLSSFLPPGGVISQVAIYPSEFGKKRMAEEEERGPPELFDAKQKDDGDSSEEDEEDEDKRKEDSGTASLSQMEYVRRYQLSRLRYYYAVVTCDSPASAAKLYDECEGLEFESSASRVDLRFIPDDMTFDETPREVCTSLPEAGRYRPSQFVTTALQQRLVRFTWDETDADRQEVVRRAATTGDVDDADIRAYLADSSDEKATSDEDAGSDREDGEDTKEDEKARIAKYRALLAEGDEDKDEEKPNGDVEMEITWGGVDLKERTEELVKRREQEKEELTPWEKYIEKQKTKKKANKAAHKQAAKAEGSSSDSDSDSDLPSDLADDPFFKEELDARKAETKQKKKGKTQGKGAKAEAEEPTEEDKAQLALLTMDDGEEDSRRHFNFKQIVKDETTAGGKKKKWKKKRKPAAVEEKAPVDDFQVDVADPRFTKMFESAEFNVDPSDARFKPTEGMKRLVGEKQRRVVAGEAPSDESAAKKSRLSAAPAPSPASAAATEDLGALVNAIKTKTKQLKKKKSKLSR